MDVATGFIPGAEGAGGDVFLHAFGGATKEGEFPIMNGAGTVRAEVGDPAEFHQGVHDGCATVFDDVGAVKQHDAGALLVGRGDAFGCFPNHLHEVVGKSGRGSVEIDERVFDGGFAEPLLEGKHLELLEVEWGGELFHRWRIILSSVAASR